MLKSCLGWQLEGAAEDPVSGEVALRLADLFRLRLNISRAGASLAVEALPGGNARRAPWAGVMQQSAEAGWSCRVGT